MRIGVSLPLATSGEQLHSQVDAARAADEFGYDAVWVPEAYGADAVSVLATMAAHTERVSLGAAVLQIPGRTPALTAMTAAALQSLSSGRFRLGLGVSGPQVSEGWHGVGFADPLGRTEEYIAIVRQALARRTVSAPGPHFPLPLPEGAGIPLRLAFRDSAPPPPIYLAAVGPKNIRLAGRVADGWLAIFFDHVTGSEQIAALRQAAAAADRDPDAIDVAVSAPLAFGSDRLSAARHIRPYAALYIGGMGSRTTNFYHRSASRMGFAAEADEVQRRYLSRDTAGAAATVPQEFIERTCLVGSDDDVRASLRQLARAGVTSVNIVPMGAAPEQLPDVLQRFARLAAQVAGEGA